MYGITSKTIIITAYAETLCLKVKQYFNWINFHKHAQYCIKDHDNHRLEKRLCSVMN